MNNEQLRKEAAEKKYPMLNSLPNSAKITVVNQRAAFKEGAEWEAERGKWIEVKTKDDLPKDNKDYWAVDKNGFVIVKHGFSILTHNTTHYQLIVKPTPPKTSKQ